ncbi:hypothetical protein [Marisediminicola antarctica]|uniref:Uncharacterized protein n=1 Tax=Marisediminicola antarctica TaxID=674079 RepID=A0A7L5AIC9_9MICO|nr:hypothetical protein [Marisediminicola antarctica]QHO68881.1 hypothetical protein BHD05_03715 [Marisediminicola antarctica]
MILTRRRKWGALLVLAGIALSLTGCRTEYRGYDSGIDGTLWRQIDSFEDPLSRSLYQPPVNEPVGYLDSLQGERWNSSVASASDLELPEGGVVLYDLSSTDSAAEVSVFIASGPRPDVPTDDGQHHDGPSQVFTCYRMEAAFSTRVMPSVDRVTFDDCPAALVELMPEGAVFASGEVFDG